MATTEPSANAPRLLEDTTGPCETGVASCGASAGAELLSKALDGPRPLRFAYADPPYYGCCGLYQHRHEEPFGCWDDPSTHLTLVNHLCDEFPDGWAMSLSSPSLQTILDLCPEDVRVGAWVKPFAVFKPNVNPGYTWEPVIFRGGRKHIRADRDPTIRDFYRQPVDAVAANITLKKGLTGAKPPAFCDWVLDLLNVRPGDELVDVFPGTGVMGERFAARCEEADDAVA